MKRRDKMLWQFLILILIILFIYNSPMLIYPLSSSINPCNSSETVSINGSALIVSDLHIKTFEEPAEMFKSVGEFARTNGIKNIVIVGDFLNKPLVFNGYSDVDLFLKDFFEIIGGIDEKVFIITGSPAHDPQTIIPGVYGGVTVVGKCGIFLISGHKVVAYHGDHISRQGSLGFGFSYLTRRLLLERLWKGLSDIEGQTFSVTGHTHVAGLDTHAKVGNPGGWKKIPVFNPPLGKGIVVDKDGLRLEDILAWE